jgi:methyl-accepting chemotaxis protein
MNRPERRRVIGIALMALGGIGLVICLAAMVAVARLQEAASTYLVAKLDALAADLDVTADGLVVIADSLTQLGVTTASIQRTLEEVDRGLGNAAQVIGNVSTVVGQDIPKVLGETNAALTTAESAARVIDRTLGVVWALLPSSRPAEPSQPLAVSIANIGASLGDLSSSLDEIETGLTTATGDIERVRVQLRAGAASVGEITRSVSDARTVVTRYQVVVSNLKREIAQLRADLPGWLTTAAWWLAALLLLLGFTQAGLIVLGWDLYTRAATASPIEAALRNPEAER